MTRPAACTIVGSNYLPLARVLARSYLDHHPDNRFVVVVIDEFHRTFGEVDSKVDVRGVDWLLGEIPEFALMAAIYDVTEFATSLKPFVLRSLLREFELVMYLDPDIRVYSPLDELIERTETVGWSLTPHCLEPMIRDGRGPRESDIMMSGIYNLGYIGVSRKALGLLDWWAERLRRDSISDPTSQLFTDQRWIDLAVPVFLPYIERNPGYNVAYWNVDQRPLSVDSGTVRVAGEPLRFFHFSGFDVETPWWLSKHAGTRPRSLMSDSHVLAELCIEYAHEVREARSEFGSPSRYKWSEALPGLPMSLPLRRLLRRELIDSDLGHCPPPPSPFFGFGSEFRSWLSLRPVSGGLPRYAQVILDSREDLRSEFGGETSTGNETRFLSWIESHGIGDHPWLMLLDRQTEAHGQAREIRSAFPLAVSGVDVVGYLRSEHGVGEAGRLAVEALSAVNVDLSLVSSRRTITRQNVEVADDSWLRHRIKLLAVNADQTKVVVDDLGVDSLKDCYVIGQWFWEVEDFPEYFQGAFEHVNEIWVATEFVAAAVREVAPSRVPVNVMPLPLLGPSVERRFQRSDLGLDDRYMFLFSFDFLSVVNRKNPFGLVQAYTEAFDESDGAQLVIKCVNGEKNLRALEELRWRVRDRGDVTVIDGYLDRVVVGGLTASSDCYVSLHRSEGLGLTMSEAMALGRPVIATAYSGNMDFMDEETAVLVPWSYGTVGKGSDPYHPTSRWADPDLEWAGDAMRRLFENPDLGRRIGEAARLHLLEKFSPRICGERMLRRLREIEKELANG